MSLNYLIFDASDDGEGTGTWEAMASVREADLPAVLAEAQAVCNALGLGELLQRMPGGLHQRIGETGWQLSHGERSRLFLARALLQRAPLTVLDETFASLDPETMSQCLACVQRHSRTLLVIAHP